MSDDRNGDQPAATAPLDATPAAFASPPPDRRPAPWAGALPDDQSARPERSAPRGAEMAPEPRPTGQPWARTGRPGPVLTVPAGATPRRGSSASPEPPRRGSVKVGPRLIDRAGPVRRIRSAFTLIVIAVVLGAMGATALGLIVWGFSLAIRGATSS